MKTLSKNSSAKLNAISIRNSGKKINLKFTQVSKKTMDKESIPVYRAYVP